LYHKLQTVSGQFSAVVFLVQQAALLNEASLAQQDSVTRGTLQSSLLLSSQATNATHELLQQADSAHP
jgi:hypothetical protein